MGKTTSSNIEDFIAKQNDPVWRNQTVDRAIAEVDRLRTIWPREKWADISSFHPTDNDADERTYNITAIRKEFILNPYEDWIADCDAFFAKVRAKEDSPSRDLETLFIYHPKIVVFEDCLEELDRAVLRPRAMPDEWGVQPQSDGRIFYNNGRTAPAIARRQILNADTRSECMPSLCDLAKSLQARGVSVPEFLSSPKEITATIVEYPTGMYWSESGALLSYLNSVKSEKSFMLLAHRNVPVAYNLLERSSSK